MTRADLIAALEKLDGPFTMPLYRSKQRRDLIALAERAGLTGRELDALDGALGGSLDAALTLVPDHMYVDVVRRQDGTGYACVWGDHGNRSKNSATPAIALCIAALKAALPTDTERPLTDEDRAAIANDPFAALKARE